MECIVIFHWFNPAAWLLMRELREVHEYEADNGVINNGIDATEYQLLLVKKSVGARLYSMACGFNHSKLKNRITMMLKRRTNNWARLKLLLFVPVAAGTLYAFARPEVKETVGQAINASASVKQNSVQESELQQLEAFFTRKANDAMGGKMESQTEKSTDRFYSFFVNMKQYVYAGHAVEIAAQKAKENVHAVVAIGGDGTINEIARSLVHTKTALGIIPCGSGNGLARHLQISMEPKKAIEIINEGIIDVIDYGKINEVPFFCTCGVGFDAFVSLKFAKAGRRGPLTYLEKTLLESLKYQPETYELETEDGTLKYKAFLIACGNASQYGNNAYIAPQAMLTDGLLDVTILEPFTVLDVPSLSFQLFNKTIDQNSRIKTFRCQTLRIHRTKPGVVHFDGDPMMMGENIDVKVIKEGLQVIIPRYAEKDSSNVLQRAQDYINGLKQINEEIVHKNKMILDKSKEQIKKLTKI